MRDLPSGTVTLLFSDIEGSTMLLARLGPAYADALDAQRAVLRAAWSAHDGIELGTEGDSFYVVFVTARDAVAAATQAQRGIAAHSWPQNERVRVRIGMHTGSPVVHDGAYVGMDVHRAARIAGAAHGGQVVLSAATAQLVDHDLPAGVELLDLGRHQLKDIAAPERLYQLAGEGLPADLPPLKTLGAASTLPVMGTTLVGRDGELAELAALLTSPQVRLVTLTGPGGTGKTRLAIGLAHHLTQTFPDGVYFVGLASATTPGAMWAAIGEAMNVSPESRQPPEMFTQVGESCALLVLDNLEQLPGADSVVAELLDRARRLVIVATSRSPLHVEGEHEHAVSTLELPHHDDDIDLAARSGAIQLFVQQARKVRSGFSLTADNIADVVTICRRLDGLPLALELAAARTKLLSPHALLGRLDQALDLTASGSQVPGRQRTLRQTIAWSYDLLAPSRQQLFDQLGVFAGGADLAAIEAVVDISSADHGADLFTMVEELVDASLVTVAEDVDGDLRIGMLETVRAFAQGRLGESDASAALGGRHARYFLDLAEEMSRLFYGDQYLAVRARFETEHANFLAALGWAVTSGTARDDSSERVLTGLRLTRAVSGFLGAMGAFTEAWEWLQRSAEAAAGTDSPELARCLQQMARSRRGFGDLDAAHEFATAAVAMWRRTDPAGLPLALTTLAVVEAERGNPAAARPLHEEALEWAHRSDDPVHLHQILGTQGLFEGSQGNHETALALHAQALKTAIQVGDRVSAVIHEHNGACVLRAMGRLDEAARVMRSVVPGFLEANEPALLMVIAEDLAEVLAGTEPGLAVRLLGSAERTRERLAMPCGTEQEAKVARALAATKAALTEPEWQSAYEAGRDQPLEESLQRVS